MITRFATFEVEDVLVAVTVGGNEAVGRTDREGYFAIDIAPQIPNEPNRWVTGIATLPGRNESGWQVAARIVGPDDERLVISDIDDTLLLNGIGDVARTIVETVRGNFLTRKPVPGMPELYRWLSANGTVPVAYVSSSPWNLYDFLILFLEHNKFPKGPLFLRDYGFNRSTIGGAHGSHKVAAIQEILNFCPATEVVLLGDSSQQDADAFATVIDSNTDRNFHAFIRDIGNDEKAARVEEIASAIEHGGSGSMSLIGAPLEIQEKLTAAGWTNP